MPTGRGKSAIYQVAGLLVDGATVVVSPFISLQHDQVATIVEGGTGGAVVTNSTIGAEHRRAPLPDGGFVFHAEPSDSLDSYYHEVGRAGPGGTEAGAGSAVLEG